ncbi:MAG TPA: phenylalanine--tRNA ligase subunit beta, partial [Paracoccaceae bacterium]|nr:phenylalanine--tRNA ligase subunit beta [Paracoccaceae bacterium]
GTHVPGTGVDLKPGVIRGVESNGMLCSERELMLSDEHDGIIELPADAPLGARYIDYAGLDDPVIEIAITPNRPDALGVSGIARDLAARGLGRLITSEVEKIKGSFPCPISVSIDPDMVDAAPVFFGRLIRGVTNGPSPDWLQQRLRAVGLRPISAVVDITNLVLYDRNRPLHAFDADRIAGNALRVRGAREGETLLALDEREYAFQPGMMVIADENGPQSIAGIMGGEPTGVTDATVNVFLESAHWDPVTIARTGRRLRIHSDARYRFERGADPAFAEAGLDLGTKLILDLCGGEASDVVMAGQVPETKRQYHLRPSRITELVGMTVERARQAEILADLGFEVEDPTITMMAAAAMGPSAGVVLGADSEEIEMTVTPPSWRPDIHGEADLVEEVARITSLSGLESQPLPRAAGVGRPVLTLAQIRERDARRALASRGLAECITYSFIAEDEARLSGGGQDALRLENPISSEMSHMRPSALPGLLAAAARNQAQGAGGIALFEIGAGYAGPEPKDQFTAAAAIRLDHDAPRHWSGGRRAVDLWDARSDAEAVLRALGAPVDRLMLARETPEWFHPGRSAALKLGPKLVLAEFGELHPRILREMELRGTGVAMLVYLDRLPAGRRKGTARPALELSHLPAVERDFAFVVNADVEAGEILRAVRGAEKTLIESADVFDVFAGAKAAEQLGEGRKSIAITVRLQPQKATLTDKEIEAVSERIIASVARATGAELRH